MAFMSGTIWSAFCKTGIWPFNPNVIEDAAFAPSLNTTTQATQLVPAALPNILILVVPTQTEDHINSDEPVMVINGRLARFRIGECEFRDSLNIFPNTRLADFGVKNEIDYALMEPDRRTDPNVRAGHDERGPRRLGFGLRQRGAYLGVVVSVDVLDVPAVGFVALADVFAERELGLAVDGDVVVVVDVDQPAEAEVPGQGAGLVADALRQVTVGADGEDAVAFVDDTALLATASNFKAANRKLKAMMEQVNGGFAWAESHGCEFAVEKFALIGFTQKTQPIAALPQGIPPQAAPSCKTQPIARPAIRLHNLTIKAADCHKFLGMFLDQELRFKTHAAYTIKKGMTWLDQFRHAAHPSKGISARHMHRYYLTVAIPCMLYAADVFLIPP